MKIILSAFLLIYLSFTPFDKPVFNNPGLADSESFEIFDYIDPKIGYVITKVDIALQEKSGKKFYHINVVEGNYFSTEIDIKYDDLTTISEKRTDLKTKTLIESYNIVDNNTIHFFCKEKGIDKNFSTSDKNIYSRYAFFYSFRGFPFTNKQSVTITTYMFEYGDALSMKVVNVSKEKVTVKAGKFDCYKLELSVTGWLSVFAPDKYYLYFSVEKPYRFIKYMEKWDDGFHSSELYKIIK
jgi:hypothetical protein